MWCVVLPAQNASTFVTTQTTQNISGRVAFITAHNIFTITVKQRLCVLFFICSDYFQPNVIDMLYTGICLSHVSWFGLVVRLQAGKQKGPRFNSASALLCFEKLQFMDTVMWLCPSQLTPSLPWCHLETIKLRNLKPVTPSRRHKMVCLAPADTLFLPV